MDFDPGVRLSTTHTPWTEELVSNPICNPCMLLSQTWVCHTLRLMNHTPRDSKYTIQPQLLALGRKVMHVSVHTLNRKP